MKRGDVYRNLAYEAEMVEDRSNLASLDRNINGLNAFFVCNHVQEKMGLKEREIYEIVWFENANAQDLWDLLGECMPVRVLMLCFMAAMADAGDA